MRDWGLVGLENAVAVRRHGAAMVKDGQLVILDGGTTAAQLARHLPIKLRATIVTHSPTVAVELARHPHLEIIMLGGRLLRHSMVNVGASVVEAASRYRADLYLLPHLWWRRCARSPRSWFRLGLRRSCCGHFVRRVWRVSWRRWRDVAARCTRRSLPRAIHSTQASAFPIPIDTVAHGTEMATARGEFEAEARRRQDRVFLTK